MTRPQQALECMHTYHKDCLQEYMSVTGKPFRYACPQKCFYDELVVHPVVDAADVVVNVPEEASETAQDTAVQDQEQLLAMADDID